jgi:hypothetical protein
MPWSNSLIEAATQDPRQPNFASRVERELEELRKLFKTLELPIADLKQPISDVRLPPR